MGKSAGPGPSGAPPQDLKPQQKAAPIIAHAPARMQGVLAKAHLSIFLQDISGGGYLRPEMGVLFGRPEFCLHDALWNTKLVVVHACSCLVRMAAVNGKTSHTCKHRLTLVTQAHHLLRVHRQQLACLQQAQGLGRQRRGRHGKVEQWAPAAYARAVQQKRLQRTQAAQQVPTIHPSSTAQEPCAARGISRVLHDQHRGGAPAPGRGQHQITV